jgi:hypothetical protein
MNRIPLFLNLEDICSERVLVHAEYTVGKLMLRIRERCYNTRKHPELILNSHEALFLYFKPDEDSMINMTIQPITKRLHDIYSELGSPTYLCVVVKREHTFG